MSILLSTIISFLGDNILDINGGINKQEIKHLKPPNEVDEYTLDWINSLKANKQEIAESTKAKVIIVDKEVEYSISIQNQEKVLIYVSNPKLNIAIIANEFFTPKVDSNIHKSAVIHRSAKIGLNVYIGPNCIIGNCIIGNNVEIHGNVFIYDNVTIKNNVEIHAGVIIGSEAHNFVEDENGNKIKFPHLGGVIIEDDVIIGAQSVISKGVLSNTVIGKGTKIAQLVFIGANNQIGYNCAIRPNVMTSGSVNIGHNSILASSATIREQCSVGSNCIIGMSAVVTKSVPKGETWIGNPAKKMNI